MARETRESSFDELARALASGELSRRKALKLMGAALVGGTLASLGIGEAAADDECKPANKKCRKDKQCCSGNCVNSKCSECPSGQVACGGGCVSTSCCCGRIFNPTTCQCDVAGPNAVACFCNFGGVTDISGRCTTVACSSAEGLQGFCTTLCRESGAEFVQVAECVENFCLR